LETAATNARATLDVQGNLPDYSNMLPPTDENANTVLELGAPRQRPASPASHVTDLNEGSQMDEIEVKDRNEFDYTSNKDEKSDFDINGSTRDSDDNDDDDDDDDDSSSSSRSRSRSHHRRKRRHRRRRRYYDSSSSSESSSSSSSDDFDSDSSSSSRSRSRSRRRHSRRHGSRRRFNTSKLRSHRSRDTDSAALQKIFKDIKPVNSDLFKKVMRAKNPPLRFQLVWWYIISKLTNKDQWIDYLASNGFKAPDWVDFAAGSRKGPFPIQWGNMGITCEAVGLLFDIFITYYKKRPNYVAKLVLDKASFQTTIHAACTRLYSKRAITQTIKQITDEWEGKPNLSLRFKKILKSLEFKKVSINHYRADGIPSGKFADAKGCIAPSIFKKISSEKSKKLMKNIQSYHGNPNHYNLYNKSNYDRNYNRGYRGNRSRNGYNDNNNYNNRNGNYNAVPTIPNGPSMTLRNTIYATSAPSGCALPAKNSIRTPATNANQPLFAPKIKYFADAMACTEVPRHDKAWQLDDNYFTFLGCVPPGYCADYQSSSCRRSPCHLYHICEWCAGHHTGNNCKYRPAIALRGQKRN